jgi:hypothetical protein
MIVTIILIIIIVLYISSQIVNNKSKSNRMTTLDNTDINLITKENRCKNKKKYKTFISRPIQYDCLDNAEFTSEDDKFIDEYVFKSRLFCDKTKENTDYSKKNLAEYRDGFFDFRNKTNISTNLITPVDNVNEMILTNPDLTGQNISDIYDKLVDNKQNLVFGGR